MTFAIMGGVSESYFSAYAVFLKASAPQVGILASLPPLLASLAQMFAVWLGQVSGERKRIIVAGAIIQVFALLAIAFLPFLFPDYAFPLLLGAVVVYFIGPNLGAPLWASLMGALIPESVRGRYFARRNRLSSMASFGALIGAGLVLQFFDAFVGTYWGFMAIFVIGMIARGISSWHLHQIHDPAAGRPELPFDERDGIPSLSVLRDNPNFLRFSVFFACMQFAVAISGPFVVVYLLRDLEYNYLQLTVNTAASVMMQFIVLARWGRLADLFGNRIILRVTGFAIPVVPLLWLLSADFWYLVMVQLVSGLLWSGYSLSASNFLFDLTPPGRRAGLMAVHNLLSGVAVFLGASFGGYLALVMPTRIDVGWLSASWLSVFYGLFLVSSLLRLVIAGYFLPHLEEVRPVRRMSYHGLIFRVTRFSPISGVIFDVVSRIKSGADRPDKQPPD